MLPVRRGGTNRDLARGGLPANFDDVDRWLERFWNWSRPVGVTGGYDVDVSEDADHIYLEA